MAYPFVQFPTWSEFIGRLTSNEFGCEYDTVEGPMVVDGDENQCISIHFLKRTVDGELCTYAVFIHDYEARVAPSVLRSVCDRLGVDHSAFGLNLG